MVPPQCAAKLTSIMANSNTIKEALAHIFRGISILGDAFGHRKFTIDGRLVGDVGEIIAELNYAIALDAVGQSHHDATTTDGRRVQIKATFKDQLTFRYTPDLYLGFKLHPDGEYEEVFNGPGRIIFDRYCHRKGIGERLLSFPVSELKRLSAQIGESDRVPKRTEA